MFLTWIVFRYMTLNIPKVCLAFLLRDIPRDPGNLMRNMIGNSFLELKPRLARQGAEIKKRKCHYLLKFKMATKAFLHATHC